MNPRIIAATALLALAPHLKAGTPLICHPYSIGDARTLPAAGSTGPDYNRTHLVSDTLALLTPEMPVIVRMETLRRAVLHATGDRAAENLTAEDNAIIGELLARLEARASRDGAGALARFDYGFFAETLRHRGVNRPVDGYALVKQALAMRGKDPDMEFALALASAWPHRRPDYEQHAARARAGAANSALLAENVASHLGGS